MQMGDISTLAIVTIAAIFQALIIGSVYYPLPDTTAGFFSRGGVMFFAILYNSFTGMAEITSSYAQRPILVRQRSFAMLRPSADMLARELPLDYPFLHEPLLTVSRCELQSLSSIFLSSSLLLPFSTSSCTSSLVFNLRLRNSSSSSCSPSSPTWPCSFSLVSLLLSRSDY